MKEAREEALSRKTERDDGWSLSTPAPVVSGSIGVHQEAVTERSAYNVCDVRGLLLREGSGVWEFFVSVLC